MAEKQNITILTGTFQNVAYSFPHQDKVLSNDTGVSILTTPVKLDNNCIGTILITVITDNSENNHIFLSNT